MKIVPISQDDLIEIKLLKNIGVCTADLSNIYGLYVNEDIVGFSQHLKIGYYLEIDNLHILKDFRYKGYGKMFIDKLKLEKENKVSYISGQSKPSAVGFWENMGASFDEDINDDTIAKAEEEGYCFPFSIKLGSSSRRMNLL